MKRQRKNEIKDEGPIDEQEQEMIVLDLERQCIKDTQNMSKLLSYTCHVLAVISLSTFPYLHHLSSKFFPINTCIVHIVAGYIANNIVRHGDNDFDSSKMNTLGYLGIIMTLCPFLLQYFLPIADEDQLIIYLLAASNVLSIMTVSYMRVETRKTFHQLNELKFAQYKHKSL